MADVSSWSPVAANNNAAAPNGFPEGMPPSGVNDSAREVMASVRRWHDEVGGILNGGSVYAYSTTAAGTTYGGFYIDGRGALEKGDGLVPGTTVSWWLAASLLPGEQLYIGNVNTQTLMFGAFRPQLVLVSELPTPSVDNPGDIYIVTDALAPAWNASVVGGGAVTVPVMSDGAAWKVR